MNKLDFTEVDYPYDIERIGELYDIANDDRYYILRNIISVFGKYYKYNEEIKKYKFIINSELFYGVTDIFTQKTNIDDECFQEGLWRERKVFELLDRYKGRIPYFSVKSKVKKTGTGIGTRRVGSVEEYAGDGDGDGDEYYDMKRDILSLLIHEDVMREYGYEYIEDREKSMLYITISIENLLYKLREKYSNISLYTSIQNHRQHEDGDEHERGDEHEYREEEEEEVIKEDIKWMNKITTFDKYKILWLLLYKYGINME